MTNPNRNPRELREFVEKCKSMEPLEASFQNLRNISDEEKTEIGKLKSRIDEQSRLIMILKQRGDDLINKNMSLESMNTQIETELENVKRELKLADVKYELIDKQFKVLSQNHDELIKIKDDYKNKNIQLLERFKDQTVQAERERHLKEEITTLQNQIIELKKVCEQSNLKFIDFTNEATLNLNKKLEEAAKKSLQDKNEIKKLQGTLGNLENEIKYLQTMNEETKKTLNDQQELLNLKINQLQSDKNELILKLRQTEDDKMKAINNTIEIEKKMKALDQKFHNDMKNFTENNSMQKLRTQLKEANEKNENLLKEFDAYKSYSNSLINKEREINQKLTFLMN
jgi:chromosome segregation ATPase